MSNKKTVVKKIRVNEETPQVWEDNFVFSDMSSYFNKEYLVYDEDEYSYHIKFGKVKIPKPCATVIGEEDTHHAAFREGTEENKRRHEEAQALKRRRGNKYW